MKRSFFITLALYTLLALLLSSWHWPQLSTQPPLAIGDIRLIHKKLQPAKPKSPNPEPPSKTPAVSKEPKPAPKKQPHHPEKHKPRIKHKLPKKHPHPKKRPALKKKRPKAAPQLIKEVRRAPKSAPHEAKNAPSTAKSLSKAKETKSSHQAPDYSATYLHNYLRRIREAIIANRYYPRIARKMRRQGEVKVGFVILPDGRLDDLHVVQSSGYTLLDRAAITTIKRASHAFPKPKKAVKLVVPIEYRIE